MACWDYHCLLLMRCESESATYDILDLDRHVRTEAPWKISFAGDRMNSI